MKSYKELVPELEKFLKDYSTDISKIEYNEDNGYPLRDALFDRILLEDFGVKYAKKHHFFKYWLIFNDWLDEDDSDAIKLWDTMCDMVYAKVDELLRQ